jgi:hypothetical protein
MIHHIHGTDYLRQTRWTRLIDAVVVWLLQRIL